MSNVLNKTRRSFVKPIKLAEQYDMSRAQIYKLLSLPVFSETIVRIGTKTIRVDQDKFYEVLEKYYK